MTGPPLPPDVVDALEANIAALRSIERDATQSLGTRKIAREALAKHDGAPPPILAALPDLAAMMRRRTRADLVLLVKRAPGGALPDEIGLAVGTADQIPGAPAPVEVDELVMVTAVRALDRWCIDNGGPNLRDYLHA